MIARRYTASLQATVCSTEGWWSGLCDRLESRCSSMQNDAAANGANRHRTTKKKRASGGSVLECTSVFSPAHTARL